MAKNSARDMADILRSVLDGEEQLYVLGIGVVPRAHDFPAQIVVQDGDGSQFMITVRKLKVPRLPKVN